MAVINVRDIQQLILVRIVITLMCGKKEKIKVKKRQDFAFAVEEIEQIDINNISA